MSAHLAQPDGFPRLLKALNYTIQSGRVKFAGNRTVFGDDNGVRLATVKVHSPPAGKVESMDKVGADKISAGQNAERRLIAWSVFLQPVTRTSSFLSLPSGMCQSLRLTKSPAHPSHTSDILQPAHIGASHIQYFLAICHYGMRPEALWRLNEFPPVTAVYGPTGCQPC